MDISNKLTIFPDTISDTPTENGSTLPDKELPLRYITKPDSDWMLNPVFYFAFIQSLVLNLLHPGNLVSATTAALHIIVRDTALGFLD